MDTVVPVCSDATIENGNSGYYTPKGHLNQTIIKEAEAARSSRRLDSPRISTTSSEYSVPVSPFPSTSPLIVISPPKDESAPITILPASPRPPMPETHRRSLIVAIIAAFLVFIAVIFMLQLVINA
ncbi:unnamed protein product [Caenorhabditis bovis]|uniref:Uncharacterized protein n=1 Tax=Caenorhabditis bovis TaxID=2654633 RepID=A0A8S1EPD4_9PELO|nr:unnamed protein product [Caenorhabditis bovis]